jgi:hypothetical protein
MIVYSRLYRGDVHAFSMSWCSEDGSSKQVAQGIWPPADVSSGTRLMQISKRSSCSCLTRLSVKELFLAKCDFKGWISGPKETETVYPTAGNLHEFHAGAETCTFIDVFIPPYNSDRVRHFYTPDCFIYKPSDRASHVPSYGPLSAETHHMSIVEVGSIVKLRPIDDPRHYRINRMPYTSPSLHFADWHPFS